MFNNFLKKVNEFEQEFSSSLKPPNSPSISAETSLQIEGEQTPEDAKKQIEKYKTILHKLREDRVQVNYLLLYFLNY